MQWLDAWLHIYLYVSQGRYQLITSNGSLIAEWHWSTYISLLSIFLIIDRVMYTRPTPTYVQIDTSWPPTLKTSIMTEVTI